MAGTNNSEKHGKQNEKGEAQKNSSNTRRTTAVTAEVRKDESGEKTTKRRNDVQRKVESDGRVTQSKQKNVEE